MKTYIKTLLAILFAMIIPGVASAINPVPIDPLKRVHLIEFVDKDFHQIGTDSEDVYWWDAEFKQLVLFDLDTGEMTATQQGTNIFDLKVLGDKIIFVDADRSDYFVYINTTTDEVNSVETGRFVDSVNCFDGENVAYISEEEFWVYNLLTNQQELISSKVNGSFFFCSLDSGYISFNDEVTGNSRVRLKKLGESGSTELSATIHEGRSSVVMGDTVYFVELFTIYSYHIPTGVRGTLYSGASVGGYADIHGNHFLTFVSSEENTLPHIYLAMPNVNDVIYRLSHIDNWSGGYAFYNGVITWLENKDGETGIFAANMFAFDSDKDLVSDMHEIFVYGTNAFSTDTDGDGYDDGTEIQNGYDPLSAPSSDPVAVDEALIDQLAGKILLQVESNGEAWYVDPITRKRYYMKNGEVAFNMLRSFGLGISNSDLSRIPADTSFTDSLRGRILLQVEANGEAYYINPNTGSKMYLKDGEAAFQVMRDTGLGITNADLSKIPVGNL